jgi:PRTRC genetic system protein B
MGGTTRDKRSPLTLRDTRIIARAEDYLIWRIPAGQRPMHLAPRADISHSEPVPWPALLVVVSEVKGAPSGSHNGRCQVFALDRQSRPGMQTPLFHAPLLNTNSDGQILGNAPLEEMLSGAGDCNALSRTEVERIIVTMRFTHLLNPHALKQGTGAKGTKDLIAFYRRLSAQGIQRFPKERLTATGLCLRDLPLPSTHGVA